MRRRMWVLHGRSDRGKSTLRPSAWSGIAPRGQVRRAACSAVAAPSPTVLAVHRGDPDQELMPLFFRSPAKTRLDSCRRPPQKIDVTKFLTENRGLRTDGVGDRFNQSRQLASEWKQLVFAAGISN